jgi:hypothetical protein
LVVYTKTKLFFLENKEFFIFYFLFLSLFGLDPTRGPILARLDWVGLTVSNMGWDEMGPA